MTTFPASYLACRDIQLSVTAEPSPLMSDSLDQHSSLSLVINKRQICKFLQLAVEEETLINDYNTCTFAYGRRVL